MMLSGFTIWAILIGLVPLMTERGAGASTAAWALGLCGLGQILGRTLYGPLARRTGLTPRTAGLMLACGAVTAALGLVPGPVWLLVAIAVLAGLVRGNLTLLQATAVADRWGTADYGRLSALMAAPVTVTNALAPVATAALAGLLGGHHHLFTGLALVSVLAAVLAIRSAAAGRPARLP